MLRLTFLGTGTSQGVPMIGCGCEVCRSQDSRDKRLRSSVMIERIPDTTGDCAESTCTAGSNVATAPNNVTSRIVIDAGPDFRYQMLREGVRTLDAILLTHEHKDHMAGIDDVRAFNYFDRRPIPIYATEQVGKVVRKDFDYAFGETHYPGVPEIDLRIIDPETSFDAAGFDILPVTGSHFIIPVTGYRIGALAYLTDFNGIDEENIDKLKGVDVLIINALRHQKHMSHFTVAEAVEISRKTGARKTYLTHMSHQIGLHADIHDTLPDGVEFACDGMKITVCE